MTKFQPYKIQNIDLCQEAGFSAPITIGEGCYTVLWWKEIALGNFFIEPDEIVSDNDYHDKIVATILPVANFYENKNKTGPAVDWNEFSLTAYVPLWKSRLERVFAAWITKNLPETIPISVIVPTRNRSNFISQCLTRLMELEPRPQEIIVVDNAPDDNSTRDVVSQFPEVKYFVEPRPGLDIARNRGIRESSSQLIAFCDDDVQVHPLWAYRVWETFQDESIVAMTGLIFASSLSTEAAVLFEKYWSFNLGYVDKTYDKAYFTASLPNGPPVWEIGAGANMAFRRSVFDEVGYFHELLDVGAAGAHGDTEIWFRILAHGKSIQYNPRAVAYHTHRSDIRALKQQLYNYMRGSAAALLWQNRQKPTAGYRRNLFLMLVYYAITLVRAFPGYTARNKTLWVEIKGVIAGIVYFYKKENRSLFSVKE
jgi:glycosyltransferase involved in cell wall biosynthesis